MSAPYPWLAGAWAELVGRLAQGRLAHAYLLSGHEGLGKFALANAFARFALCEAPAADAACGGCRACLLVGAGNHPDLKVVVTEEGRKSIVIDQVRELIEFYALKPHYGSRKVAIVHPAEVMNSAAANALLKLLEEPPRGALLLLVAHRPAQLLATILSRCHKLKLAAADPASCRAWLAEQCRTHPGLPDPASVSLAGAPLEQLAELEREGGPVYDRVIDTLAGLGTPALGVLEAARRHAGDDGRRLLDAIELVVRGIAVLQSGAAPRHLQLTAAATQRLHAIANKLNSRSVFAFLDQLAEARATVLRSAGVRGTDVIENLWYSWARMTQTEAPR